MQSIDFYTSQNIIDIRDIIERIEELEAVYADCPDNLTAEDGEELATLNAIMEDLKGSGGDEQWRGDWYPVTLIRDDYFVEYAQELAEDCGMVNDNASWPNNCIDWDKAARELQYDYSSTEIDGVTFWYR